MQIKVVVDKIKVEIIGGIGALCIFLLYSSLRWKRGDVNHGWDDNTQKIVTFWHERLLMGVGIFKAARGDNPRPIHVLISEHHDGRLIARAIEFLGLKTVAGSSTRGGVRGLIGLISRAKEGHNLAITPDGPKGPARDSKLGVFQLARATGLPIYPMTYSAEKRWRLGSWDKMVVPKPFSRAVALYGLPIYVAREANEEQIREAKEELDRQLVALGDRADSFRYEEK